MSDIIFAQETHVNEQEIYTLKYCRQISDISHLEKRDIVFYSGGKLK